MRNLLLNVHQRGGDDVTCIHTIPKVQFWLLLFPSVRLKMKRHRCVYKLSSCFFEYDPSSDYKAKSYPVSNQRGKIHDLFSDENSVGRVYRLIRKADNKNNNKLTIDCKNQNQQIFFTDRPPSLVDVVVLLLGSAHGTYNRL